MIGVIIIAFFSNMIMLMFSTFQQWSASICLIFILFCFVCAAIIVMCWYCGYFNDVIVIVTFFLWYSLFMFKITSHWTQMNPLGQYWPVWMSWKNCWKLISIFSHESYITIDCLIYFLVVMVMICFLILLKIVIVVVKIFVMLFDSYPFYHCLLNYLLLYYYSISNPTIISQLH